MEKLEESTILNKKKNIYEKDFNKLIELGLELNKLFVQYCDDNNSNKKKNDAFSRFFSKYQIWYSESISFIKNIFPDRLTEFKSLYEKQSKRKDVTSDNYVIEDALNGLYVYRCGKSICKPNDALIKFQRQLFILRSLSQVFKSSLFSLKTMLQADLFDSEIVAAQNLNNNGYHRAAGAMCGVLIEKHLQEIYLNHNLSITKKNPGINDFNDLLKNNNIYQISTYRKIQYLADIRNKCDHKRTDEPTKEEVKELIDGTDWLIKNIF